MRSVKAVHAASGKTPGVTTGGTSDGRFIATICPSSRVRPVGKTIHQIDECVAVADCSRSRMCTQGF